MQVGMRVVTCNWMLSSSGPYSTVNGYRESRIRFLRVNKINIGLNHKGRFSRYVTHHSVMLRLPLPAVSKWKVVNLKKLLLGCLLSFPHVAQAHLICITAARLLHNSPACPLSWQVFEDLCVIVCCWQSFSTTQPWKENNRQSTLL